MCLIIPQRPKPEPSIAGQDYISWKILDSSLRSLIYCHRYTLGELNRGVLGQPEFHDIPNPLWVIEEGFHSYTSMDCCDPISWPDCVLVECVVPKGSIYYLGDRGEMVSDQIIIKRKVGWLERLLFNGRRSNIL